MRGCDNGITASNTIPEYPAYHPRVALSSPVIPVQTETGTIPSKTSQSHLLLLVQKALPQPHHLQ